jgi:hypothetical protein
MPHATEAILDGVHRAERLSWPELDALLAPLIKSSYPHDEVHGEHCFLGDHIAAPYDAVFDYCADVRSLSEWTVNIGPLERIDGPLHRGKMIFSREDAKSPTTDIYIRADAMKGPEHGLICYPCAWDEGHELWMRYYFVLTDAEKTLGRPGTAVLWGNCKHPYYDRATAGVPAYVEAGRARTDRPWAGDGWSGMYALHRLELSNLKRIAEARFGSGS